MSFITFFSIIAAGIATTLLLLYVGLRNSPRLSINQAFCLFLAHMVLAILPGVTKDYFVDSLNIEFDAFYFFQLLIGWSILIGAWFFSRRFPLLSTHERHLTEAKIGLPAALFNLGVIIVANTAISIFGVNNVISVDSNTAYQTQTFQALTSFFLVPIAEEVFYRKIIVGGLLTQYSKRTSIGLSSLFFMLSHDPSQYLWVLLGGVFYGIVYAYTSSLRLVVVLHAMYNLIGWYTNYLGVREGIREMNISTKIFVFSIGLVFLFFSGRSLINTIRSNGNRLYR